MQDASARGWSIGSKDPRAKNDSYPRSRIRKMPRTFRLKIRPGRAVLTATSDSEREPAASAAAGDEVVVSEKAAAFLIRQHAVDIVESSSLLRTPRSNL